MDIDQDELPVFEVIIREKGSDCAVIVFFRNGDGTCNAVVGLIATEDTPVFVEVLGAAVTALANATNWVTLDERPLHSSPF